MRAEDKRTRTDRKRGVVGVMIRRCQRKPGPLDERITVVVSAESRSDGSLALVVRAVDGIDCFRMPRRIVAVSIWNEDGAVRMSLRNAKTGQVAYVQGGAPLLEWARDLAFGGPN